MSKPEAVSNTNEPELAGGAERRASSRRMLRSIWCGLFLGVLPMSGPLFWLALPLPVIVRARFVLVVLAAVAGHFAYPQLDIYVEPVGVTVLQSSLAHATLSNAAKIPLLNSLQWYNSVTAGYVTIFMCGTVVLAFVKQAFRLGMALGTTRRTESVKIRGMSTAVVTPSVVSEPERAVLDDVAAIEKIVQSTFHKVPDIKKPLVQPLQSVERTLIVHDGHAQVTSKHDAQTQAISTELDRSSEPKYSPTIIDLNDQVWEIPCFVENEIENVLLDEILQAMPCIVSSADQFIGIEPAKDAAATETLSPSHRHNKKRRRITVKETIIDIVRWKKPNVQNVKPSSAQVPQPKANETSAAVQATETTQEISRSSPVPEANLQQLASSTIVMAAEPLPYLMGYLSNLNRSNEKSGGR